MRNKIDKRRRHKLRLTNRDRHSERRKKDTVAVLEERDDPQKASQITTLPASPM